MGGSARPRGARVERAAAAAFSRCPPFPLNTPPRCGNQQLFEQTNTSTNNQNERTKGVALFIGDNYLAPAAALTAERLLVAAPLSVVMSSMLAMALPSIYCWLLWCVVCVRPGCCVCLVCVCVCVCDRG